MTRLPFFCPQSSTTSWRGVAPGVLVHPYAEPRAFGMYLSGCVEYAAQIAAQLSAQHAPETTAELWRVFAKLLHYQQDVLVVGPDVPPTLPFVPGRTVVSIVAGPNFEPGPSPLLKALIEEAKLVTINFAAPLVSAYGCLPSTGGFPVVIESEPCVVRPWLGYLSHVYRRAEPISVIAGEGDKVVRPTMKAMWGEELSAATGRPS